MNRYLFAIVGMVSIAAFCAAQSLVPSEPHTTRAVAESEPHLLTQPAPPDLLWREEPGPLSPPPTPAPYGMRGEEVIIAFAPQGYKREDALYTDGRLISLSDQGYVHLRDRWDHDILIPSGTVIWIDRGSDHLPTTRPTAGPQ